MDTHTDTHTHARTHAHTHTDTRTRKKKKKITFGLLLWGCGLVVSLRERVADFAAENLCRFLINRHRGRLTLIIIIIITITTIITTTTVASFAVAPVIAAHPFTLC